MARRRRDKGEKLTVTRRLTNRVVIVQKSAEPSLLLARVSQAFELDQAPSASPLAPNALRAGSLPSGK